MSNRSIESRLLAHEAVIKALMLHHPNPQKAFYEFTQIYPAKVRELNKDGSPEKAAIAKELIAECQALSPFFPKA